jgi:hypothetical protein
MHQRKREAAARGLERLALCEENEQLAGYWLSLWHNDEPPERSAFNVSHIRRFLPGVLLLEINSTGDIHCRLAGTAIDAGLGFFLTGRSFLDFVPKSERHIRQERLASVVDGAVAAAKTMYENYVGDSDIMENLHLPFSGQSENGSRQFLIHTNVRPNTHEIVRRPRSWNAGFPDEYVMERFA